MTTDNDAHPSRERNPAADVAPTNHATDVEAASGLKRTGMLVLAAIFFVLGALGAILPVLPTTPFLLLTSYFLVRSSPQLNHALLRSRFFGPILTDWQVHRGVRRDVKVKAVLVVIATVSLSLYLAAPPFWLVCAVVAQASVGITVILRLPDPAE